MYHLLKLLTTGLVFVAVYLAQVSSVSASYFMYYEPELPEELH